MHTNIGDVYLFLEAYLGQEGIMTHQIPSAFQALQPIIKTKLGEQWFNKEWIKTGLDAEVVVADLTDDEKKEFWKEYEVYASQMWDKIKDKTIAIVH